jgi:hypothetical protein
MPITPCVFEKIVVRSGRTSATAQHGPIGIRPL